MLCVTIKVMYLVALNFLDKMDENTISPVVDLALARYETMMSCYIVHTLQLML